METFSTLRGLCAGNSLVTGEFPAQKPVTQGVDVFFDEPELTVEETIVRLWIWDTTAPIMTSL